MAPPMDRLCGAVQAMDGWNRSDPKNVVVVHCKGGKGRTGVIIACYMLQTKIFDDPEQAMYHFAVKRFLAKNPNKTGITGMGQRRYVVSNRDSLLTTIACAVHSCARCTDIERSGVYSCCFVHVLRLQVRSLL